MQIASLSSPIVFSVSLDRLLDRLSARSLDRSLTKELLNKTVGLTFVLNMLIFMFCILPLSCAYKTDIDNCNKACGARYLVFYTELDDRVTDVLYPQSGSRRGVDNRWVAPQRWPTPLKWLTPRSRFSCSSLLSSHCDLPMFIFNHGGIRLLKSLLHIHVNFLQKILGGRFGRLRLVGQLTEIAMFLLFFAKLERCDHHLDTTFSSTCF